MAKPFLSVVIPAYNEASRLPLTLIDVDRHLSHQEYSYEIVVVISHSADHTAEIVKRFASFLPNLKYIALPENRGKGFAVKTGMLAAKGTYRLYMDADNSTAVVEFNKFLPYLRGGKGDEYDVVIGSRKIHGARMSPLPDFSRRFFAGLAQFFVRLLVVRGFKDTQCGFKAFSSEAATALFTSLKTDGFLFDIELLARAKQANLKVKEVPIYWAHNPGSKMNPRHYMRGVGELLRLSRMLRRETGL